jgi:outer membrane protein, multidrug efflux system
VAFGPGRRLHTMTARYQLFLSASAALLAACAARSPAPDAQNVPSGFEHQAGSSVSAAAWPAQGWYRDFGSDELTELITAASQANADLGAARARVIQADARARQAGAAILPSVDANGNANYLAGHSAQGGGHELDWAALLSASYEVDFWGKNRATADSARLLADAARAERDAVALTALAAVADGYFQILALRERVTVARSNRDVAQQLLAVIQTRAEVGVATALELATQQSAFDAAQISVSELEQTQEEALAALATLLGKPPEAFRIHGQPLQSLHEPVVAAGLPSELLARRPDILLAEANLKAANANVVAARAAMFPALSLTASGGVQNPALPATVLTIPGIGPSFALGANLVQPIFDHGRLKAQRDEARGRSLELLATYRAAIVAAFADVENALGAIQHLDDARRFQLDNLAQSERAFAGAQARYQAGSVDFLTLLEAQRNLFSARDQTIRYQLARLQAHVTLCKVLGGGWQQHADAATEAAATPANPSANTTASGQTNRGITP